MFALHPTHLLQSRQAGLLAPGQPQTALALAGLAMHALQWHAEARLGAPE
jgi:hypothetical protein